MSRILGETVVDREFDTPLICASIVEPQAAYHEVAMQPRAIESKR
jgi:hypothetical protein